MVSTRDGQEGRVHIMFSMGADGKDNHNCQRMTRFLISLRLLNRQDVAGCIWNHLQQLVSQGKISPSAECFQYWCNAMKDESAWEKYAMEKATANSMRIGMNS